MLATPRWNVPHPMLVAWCEAGVSPFMAATLLRMGFSRSGGTLTPAIMYLKMRAWCSSSAHCPVVKGARALEMFCILMWPTPSRPMFREFPAGL